MLLRPGSSAGVMWLYTDTLAQLDAEGMTHIPPVWPSAEDVAVKMNALCPDGWSFAFNGTQWGLWPYDLMKYGTHGLLYLARARRMVEVKHDIHG